MKSIYELDLNMGMMMLGLILGLNGYTSATLVLELCLVLTTLFFTNPNKSELVQTIKISEIYIVGVIGLTMIIVPSWSYLMTLVMCINGFTMFCWYQVAPYRKRISHRLDQMAYLFALMIIVFLLAAWIMPVEWMVLYSPMVSPWLIRIAMSIMVLWMLLPLPVLMVCLHHYRIRYKQHRLMQRLMD